MKSGISTGVRLAGWTTAGVLVLGAAAGTATAVTSHHDNGGGGGGGQQGPAGPGRPGEHGGPGHGGPGGPGGPGAFPGPVVHSVATVKTKSGKYVTVKQQQGTVDEVTAESITVTSSDEYAANYVITSKTKFCKNGKEVSASKIDESDKVFVLAKKSGSSYDALSVNENTKKPHPQH